VKRSSLLALAALVTAGIPHSVSAQEQLGHQHQGSGYSIRYPAGWRVIDPRSTSAMTRAGACDLVITQGLGVEGSPNLNIVITRGEMPLNDEARETLKQIPQQAASMLRGRAENVVVRDEAINGQPGLTVQYDMTVGGKKLTQMAFSMPKGGRTYIFTCTAPKENFRSLEPTFRMMIASVEVSFLNSMPRWLLFALLGGGISLLAALLGKLFKGSPAPTSSYRI
jgi:hypothetical protein